MSVSGSFVPLSARWWRQETGVLWQALQSVVHRIRERARPRRDRYHYYAELYGGTELSGLGLTSYDPNSQVFQPASIGFNAMRNATDTIVAKISKNRPLPMFLTDHGDYGMQKKARKLTQFFEGLFKQIRIYDHTMDVFRDAAVFGTGILAVYRREDKIHVERMFPWECFVDIADGRYASPQNFYTVRWVDKDVLAELFPEHEAVIHTANITTDDLDHVADYEATADRILVTEAWHLPSGPDADDGRHSVIIEGATLLDSKWDKNYFPFAVMRYKSALAGFWGSGLGDEMSGFQAEINLMAERVQQSHYLIGGGIVLVPNGGDIEDADLTNGVGYILRYKQGFKPEWISPDPLNPATYEYLKDLPEYAMKFSGISPMSTQSQKPAGVDSGIALQTLDDIESERFTPLGRSWEELHMEVVRQSIDLCKEIVDDFPDFAVRAPLRRNAVVIDWKSVDMDRDAVIMQVFPVALLAKTPAARLQQVQDLFQAGVIDRTMFLRLLDAPDIGAEEDLEASGRIVADEQIEHMLDAEDPFAEDAYQYPEPFQDLVYALHRAQCHYNLGRVQRLAEANLELLRRYMGDAKFLLEKQFPPPPAPPQGGQPGGAPAGDMAGAPALMGQVPPGADMTQQMPQAPMPGAPMGPVGGAPPVPQAA